MQKFLFSVVLAAILAGGGCASVPQGDATRAQVPAPTAASETANLPRIELTGDLLYVLLKADFLLSRGHYDLAAEEFLALARETQDPRLAEEAARVAIYARDNGRALAAARLWLAAAPQSVEAQQVMVVALIRNGKADEALQHLEDLLSHPAASANSFRLIASLLSRQQDLQTALSVLGQLIKTRGDNPDALFAYGHLALRAGAPDAALEAIDRALALRPMWPDAVNLRVRILQMEGKGEEALAYLAKMVNKNSKSTDLRLMYAQMLMENKRYSEAIPQYEQLAKALPDNPDILFTLGLIHLQMGNLDDAQRYFERVAAIGGRNDQVQFYLGWLEEARNNIVAAIRHYGLVSNGENYLEARLRMAVLTAQQGDVESARDQLRALRTQRIGYAPRTFLVEGEILRTAGRLDEAMAVYTDGLAIAPEDRDLLYARALLADTMGRIDAAERDLRHILARDPDDVDALNALGYMLADRTQRFDEAYEYVKRALAFSPDNNAILDSMGWVLYRQGRYAESIQYLRRSLEVKQDYEVAAHLGEVLWVSGEREQARDVWEQALKRFPGEKTLIDVINRFNK